MPPTVPRVHCLAKELAKRRFQGPEPRGSRGHGKRVKKITAPTRSGFFSSGCAPEYMTLCAALSTNKGVGRRGHTSRVARSVGEFGTLFKNTEDAPEPARLNARHGKDVRAARNEISREALLPLLLTSG